VAESLNPEFLEIVPAERPQDLIIDGVLGERLRLLLKPLLGEPPRDVKHAASRPRLPRYHSN
jgi:hypothetical protein